MFQAISYPCINELRTNIRKIQKYKNNKTRSSKHQFFLSVLPEHSTIRKAIEGTKKKSQVSINFLSYLLWQWNNDLFDELTEET